MKKEYWSGIFFSVITSLVLSFGFVSFSKQVFSIFFKTSFPIELIAFPGMALVLSLTAPRVSERRETKQLIIISLLPLFVAFFHGILFRKVTLFEIIYTGKIECFAIWNVIAIPIGEELIFRQWGFKWLLFFLKDKTYTKTNPIPMVIVLSALGFSIWHLQNLGFYSGSFVVWQVFYTFVVGIWLGALRYYSGKVFPSVLGHSLINFFN